MVPRLTICAALLLIGTGCSSLSTGRSAYRPIVSPGFASQRPTYVGRPIAPELHPSIPRHTRPTEINQPIESTPVSEWKPTDRSVDKESPTGPTETTPTNLPRLPDPSAALPGDAPSPADSNEASPHRRSGLSESTKLPGSEIAGYSHERLPIHAARVGRGNRVVLVLASLYGNEADTIAFTRTLASSLTDEELTSRDTTLVIVPTPNPDGLKQGTQTNSRGVILDRNFPSRTFAARRTTLTGPTAASEVETRVVMNLLDDFRPHRVVHVRSGRGEQMSALMNELAQETEAEELNRSPISIGRFDGTFKSGSIAEYVSEELGTEMVKVELPSPQTGRQPKLTESLLTLIVGQSHTAAEEHSGTAKTQQSVTRSDAEDLFAPYEPPVTLTGEIESPPPDGKKGYVEFLPPPPEYAAQVQSSDPKYYELPPPIE